MISEKVLKEKVLKRQLWSWPSRFQIQEVQHKYVILYFSDGTFFALVDKHLLWYNMQDVLHEVPVNVNSV